MDGFSGVYTGKDFSMLDYLFKLQEIPQDLQAIYLEYLLIVDEDNIAYYANKRAANGKHDSNKNTKG